MLTRDEIVHAFLRLVGTGRIDEVRQILAASPEMVNGVGPHPFWGGRAQALHVSIETKRRDLFDMLLDAGADVNGTNGEYDNWSPLMLTSHRNRPDMRDELLRRGARIGLVEALMFGDDVEVERLLRPGAAAIPACVPNGGSILNFARTPWAIDRLIELGASIDVEDRWGSRPIASLSRLGPRGEPLVRHMIARGARATAEDYARLGDENALAAMLESDPDAVRSDEVMMGAVELGHHALAEWLLARGANVNARSREGSRHSALHSAAWNGDLAMVRLLAGAGADIGALDEQYGGTPLGWASTAIEVTNNAKCNDVVEYLARLTASAK